MSCTQIVNNLYFIVEPADSKFLQDKIVYLKQSDPCILHTANFPSCSFKARHGSEILTKITHFWVILWLWLIFTQTHLFFPVVEHFMFKTLLSMHYLQKIIVKRGCHFFFGGGLIVSVSHFFQIQNLRVCFEKR